MQPPTLEETFLAITAPPGSSEGSTVHACYLFTIARRELGAYFTSAIAYITIIVFLSLTVGLYMAPFFTILSADMRVFFTICPSCYAYFCPPSACACGPKKGNRTPGKCC